MPPAHQRRRLPVQPHPQAVSNRARNRQAREEKLTDNDAPAGCALPAPQPDVIADDHTLASRVRALLVDVAHEDNDVARLLDAYVSGLRKPADICRELDMSATQLRCARRRLNRRLEQLPRGLLAAVYDHLRRAS